jgi:hypothetical protein
LGIPSQHFGALGIWFKLEKLNFLSLVFSFFHFFSKWGAGKKNITLQGSGGPSFSHAFSSCHETSSQVVQKGT